MNEEAYRSTYREVNHQRCVFEKIVLLRYGQCKNNNKLFLAEREAMACTDENAQTQCRHLLNSMRSKSRFVLQMPNTEQPLPHSKEVKVQAGGLYGLQQVLSYQDTTNTQALTDEVLKFDNDHNQPIANITDTVKNAFLRFHDLQLFPFEEIIKAIKHFTIPPRKSRLKSKLKNKRREKN